jgi:hypothetical protein
MSEYLEARIAELLADPGSEPEPEPMEPDSLVFVHRVPLGNLRPLLWRDWRAHLQAGEHDRLSAELDEDLAAAATGELVGRARQIAWYLSAQMLIDEDRMAPAAQEGEGGEAGASAFQKSLVQLLGDLIGLDVQSTAVDADPDNEGLLRVHAPSTVVGFWFDGACWYYGCPDPDSPVGEPTNWLHAGTLPSGTSIGDLAAFITEGVGREGWPFQVDPPDDETSSLGKRRWGTR